MIYDILEEIGSTQGTKAKKALLEKHKDNEVLRNVLYLATSRRVKFYIKQIPRYNTSGDDRIEDVLHKLQKLSDREITGTAAQTYLKSLLCSLAPEDADILCRIIEKDLRIGLHKEFINSVIPGLIENTPYMGAIKFSKKAVQDLINNNEYLFSDVKMDGRYCNAIIREGFVDLESRSGEKTILDGAKFVSELSTLPDCVLNGELTIKGVPRYISNGIIMSLIDINKKRESRTEQEHDKVVKEFEKHNNTTIEQVLEKITYTVWDQLTIQEYFLEKSTTPYYLRKESLKQLISEEDLERVELIESRVVKTYEEAMEHFQEMLNRGEEGTILKSPLGEWKDGKPKWQVKVKLEFNVDLIIKGFNYGTGKNKEVISSLNCESSCGRLKTRPTGIDERMMRHITDNQESLLDTIVQVKCSGLSFDADGNYSLLHPVFELLRNDKTIADDLDSIKQIEKMCKGLVEFVK